MSRPAGKHRDTARRRERSRHERRGQTRASPRLRSRRRAAPDYRSGVGNPEQRNGDISITPVVASWHEPHDRLCVGRGAGRAIAMPRMRSPTRRRLGRLPSATERCSGFGGASTTARASSRVRAAVRGGCTLGRSTSALPTRPAPSLPSFLGRPTSRMRSRSASPSSTASRRPNPAPQPAGCAVRDRATPHRDGFSARPCGARRPARRQRSSRR